MIPFLFTDEELNPPLNPTEIETLLTQKPIEYLCEDCRSCTTADSENNIESCGSCRICGGAQGIYNNCQSCRIEESGTTCDICTNTVEEGELCSNIKSCIRDYFATGQPCALSLGGLDYVPRTSSFVDINRLLTLVRSCSKEDVKMPIGGNVERDVCEFDPSVISVSSKNPPDLFINPYSCVSDVPNICGSGITSKGCYKPGNSDICYIVQKIEFDKAYFVSRISGFYQNSPPLSESADFVFFLCKEGLDENGNVVSKCPGVEGGAYGPSYSTYNDADALCSKKEAKSPGKYCILSREECRDCGDQIRPYSVAYSSLVKNVVGVQCLRIVSGLGSPTNYACEATAVQSGLQLRKFSALLQLDNSFTSSLLYGRCDFLPSMIDKNKIYYDTKDFSSSGEGYTKIILSNLETEKQRECNFNLFMCSQNAFSNSSEDAAMEIYNFVRDLDSIDLYKPDVPVARTGEDVIAFNTAVFRLDGDYTTEQIIEAIKSGYKFWRYVSYQRPKNSKLIDWFDKVSDIPLEDFSASKAPQLSFSNNCRDDSAAVFGQFSILYNCGGDDICSGEVKVNVALNRIDRRTGDDMSVPQVSPVIQFCSSQ